MHSLIFGGNGALGRAIVQAFKTNAWTVTSIDFTPNAVATNNILLEKTLSFEETGKHVEKEVSKLVETSKIDAIVNVAGGWAGDNFASEDIYKNISLMISQSLNSTVFSLRLASLFAKENSVVVLTGAAAALNPTPSMISYGAAKAAVHHVVKSASQKGSGLPEDTKVIAILPIMLDTPMNRKYMGTSDTSTWTPLEELSNQIESWCKDFPPNLSGKLIKIVTKEHKTEYVESD